MGIKFIVSTLAPGIPLKEVLLEQQTGNKMIETLQLQFNGWILYQALG